MKILITLFLIQGIAHARVPAKLKHGIPGFVLGAKDERECVLMLAKKIVEADPASYKDIRFDKEVYFKKGFSNFYTVYGFSEKHTPQNYRLRFYASYENSNCHLSPQTLAMVSLTGETALRARVVNKEFEILNSFANTYDAEKEKALKPLDAFFVEKSYTSAKVPAKSTFHFDVDEDFLTKEIGGLVFDAALWKLSNKIPKFNSGSWKVARKFGKVFLIFEEGGHIANAYEVANDAGKPSFIAVDKDIIAKFGRVGSKAYQEFAFDYYTTGVLVDASELKTDLETATPEAKSKVETKIAPNPAPPEDKDAAERKRREEILKRLK